MSIEVVAAGFATTVQDAGRPGWRQCGVAAGGALDPWRHALANLLAGNAPGAAALECAFAGPILRFGTAARIALCGADMPADVDGHAIPHDRPVDLPAGSVLRLGRCTAGARTYLAIRGGLAIAPVLGSAGTDLRGGFGGVEGRVLRRGDRLPLALADPAPVAAPRIAPWWIDSGTGATASDGDAVVRVLPGGDATDPADALAAVRWQVAAGSNRQGLRLQGAPLRAADTHERISEPVLPGTVQLPPDGQPIVLLADAQTHGGYPRIGHVIRADWPLLAQLRPGAQLRFSPCTRAEARQALCRQQQRLHRIALAITAKAAARA